ncbi:hypothetical protein CEXT_255942 [Caerostris extrusa]|uniref:BHLH domain-containing protein n=1 Tax=Caerostris extrusa TaxID=172846 RepID=A0AAV4WIY9_CAEEX|nr:hypothetical protein CEXT_255942 [Caerostris extrusa]
MVSKDKSRQTARNLMEKCRRESVRASFNQLRQCITKNIQTEKGESSQEHFQYMEPSKRQSLKPSYDQLRYIPSKRGKMSRMDILKTTIAYIRVLKARREARQERLAIVRRERALKEEFSTEHRIVKDENDETAFAAVMQKQHVVESLPFTDADFDFDADSDSDSSSDSSSDEE